MLICRTTLLRESILRISHYVFFGVCLLCSFGVMAHTQLESSVPANKGVLTVSPEQITLSFNKTVHLINLVLMNAKNKKLALNFSASKKKASTFTTPIAINLPADTYTVVWTIIGSDGHKVKGKFPFILHSSIPQK